MFAVNRRHVYRLAKRRGALGALVTARSATNHAPESTIKSPREVTRHRPAINHCLTDLAALQPFIAIHHRPGASQENTFGRVGQDTRLQVEWPLIT